MNRKTRLGIVGMIVACITMCAMFSGLAYADDIMPPAIESPEATSAPLYCGTYDGTLRNGTGFDACRLVFDVGDGGGMVGRFSYADSNRAESERTTGVLKVQNYDEATRTISGLWVDQYGQGPVTLTFDADYKRFSGLWGDTLSSVPINRWTGHRTSAETVAAISRM